MRSKSVLISFALLSLTFATLYVWWAARLYLADRAAQVPELSSLRRAMRLAPDNAEYARRYGRFLLLTGAEDSASAVESLKRATSLDPYSSRYWLDLAQGYRVQGDWAGEAEALRRAGDADPKTPDVAWERGLFYLTHGDSKQALPQFRIVLENDPTRIADALRLCWRATQDAGTIEQVVLPPIADVHLAFLHMLQNAGQIDAARIAWNGLLQVREPWNPRGAVSFISTLLAAGRVSDGIAAWQQLLRRFPDLQGYAPENGVVNGGFELDLLNGGFDWTHDPLPHVAVALDTSQFHAGARSLCMSFDGPGVAETGMAQNIAVEPNSAYSFSAWYKADALISAAAPMFTITDARSGRVLATAETKIGTTPWREAKSLLKTGPETALVKLRITRESPGLGIEGRLCIDDVALEKN